MFYFSFLVLVGNLLFQSLQLLKIDHLPRSGLPSINITRYLSAVKGRRQIPTHFWRSRKIITAPKILFYVWDLFSKALRCRAALFFNEHTDEYRE